MAWQSLAGMGPGGQNGGGNGNPEAAQQANQPQGTEYTLQGTAVMSQLWEGWGDANRTMGQV
jgi:hypothetical protein